MAQLLPGMLLLVAMSAAPVAAEELRLGKPLDAPDSTSIHQLLARPDDFVGKTVRVEGTIADVCQMMGCWMDLKDPATGDVLKVKVDDGEITFPKTSRGKTAVAQGTLEKQVLSREQLVAALEHEAA